MRRPALALIATASILVWALVALGPPDIERSIAFFDGKVPTLLMSEAVMRLLAWAAITVALGVVLVGLIHSLDRSVFRTLRQPTTRAAILLAIGVLLLAISVVHRSLVATSLCCASGSADSREAIRLDQ